MNQENRRPLKARSWSIMQKSAKWISNKNITPNQISIGSIAFSALAAGLLLLAPISGNYLWLTMILVLLLFVGRAFCNIWDGLVALEGGKSTPAGELFNDIPDRISDALIFIAAGYAAGLPALGWLAALLAVMTAYIRTLSRSLGAPTDFQGPMAKLHRMLLVSAACIITPFTTMMSSQNYSGHAFSIALIIIALGCIITCYRRAKTAYTYLESTPHA